MWSWVSSFFQNSDPKIQEICTVKEYFQKAYNPKITHMNVRIKNITHMNVRIIKSCGSEVKKEEWVAHEHVKIRMDDCGSPQIFLSLMHVKELHIILFEKNSWENMDRILSSKEHCRIEKLQCIVFNPRVFFGKKKSYRWTKTLKVLDINATFYNMYSSHYMNGQVDETNEYYHNCASVPSIFWFSLFHHNPQLENVELFTHQNTHVEPYIRTSIHHSRNKNISICTKCPMCEQNFKSLENFPRTILFFFSIKNSH